MPKLFIIGNGFDLAHGFKTKYKDFKDWIEKQIPVSEPIGVLPPDVIFGNHGEKESDYIKGLNLLKELFDSNPFIGDEWCDFEDSLAYLNLESKYSECLNFSLTKEEQISPIAITVGEDYAYAIKNAIEQIPDYFLDWVRSIDISNPNWKVKLRREFMSDDIFLTFNYTEVLEKIYGINKKNICHIHGDRTDIGTKIVVGHGDNCENLDFSSIDVVDAKIALEESVELLRKKYNYNMYTHEDFLERIDSSITDIYSYGWSFGNSDKLYLESIIRRIKGGKNIVWHLSDRDNIDRINEIMTILRNARFNGKITTFDHSCDSIYKKLF